MKILVTGSQGTLGRPLVAELRKRGHQVWGCDLQHDADPDYVRIDVANLGQVIGLFENVADFDACYHLAGEFGRVNGQEYPAELWRTNCLGTSNIIRACTQNETRLIFASSSEAYGSLADDGQLDESLLDHQLPRFHNDYALTKFTNEQQLRIAIRNDGLDATILRFFNVYGPGEYFTPYRSVICQFIYKMLHAMPITVYTGSSRSFLYVDDWTRVVANVLDVKTVSGEAFNIASPMSYTMDLVYHMIMREVGGTHHQETFIECEDANVRDKRPSIKKATDALGLKDTVTLEEGIRKTVEWMRGEYGK